MKPEEILAARGRALADVLNIATSAIRAELTQGLAAALQSTVNGGPFAGMKLPVDVSWGDGVIMPKLLGCYEEELHSALARAFARSPSTVINIGCAEGYYAIGAARALPHAKIFAFDIDKRAQEICRGGCAVNGVENRVVVDGECTREKLLSLLRGGGKALAIIDCEGGELGLLDDADVALMMASTDVIVECHDFMDPAITKRLTGRFSPSHAVERIDQGGRNPNAFPPLRQLGEIYRWLAICENRPVSMSWLACWATPRQVPGESLSL